MISPAPVSVLANSIAAPARKWTWQKPFGRQYVITIKPVVQVWAPPSTLPLL